MTLAPKRCKVSPMVDAPFSPLMPPHAPARSEPNLLAGVPSSTMPRRRHSHPVRPMILLKHYQGGIYMQSHNDHAGFIVALV